LRVPLSWLREYVDFDLTADELFDLISLRVQEVDGIVRLGVLDGEVVVGEVQEFGPHPNADRLSVAKVDIGGQVVQIVAGAPNPSYCPAASWRTARCSKRPSSGALSPTG
jgi:phenylalanyl-tRNA synthetase beta chain